MSKTMSLETIISQLDAPFSGSLPERALREAQHRGAEIVPHLIDLIRKATAVVNADGQPTGDGHLFALYLLAELRAKEALAAIVAAVSLPGEGPFDLFGDAITEDLHRILAVLADDQPEIIDQLISDRSIDEYVRWQAARTYLHWVRDGSWTREQAVEQLGQHLATARRRADSELATGLVCELVSYSPAEWSDEIAKAFRDDLVDRMVVDEKTVEQSISGGGDWFQRELENLAPTGIQDTVDELEHWACFSET